VEKVLIFVGMGLATYFTRYAMIAALGREIPSLLRRWLRYVPAAVLAALVAPAALAPEGHLEFGIQAWAVFAGAVVAWFTRNVLATIVGGLAVFWVLRAAGVG
jgi:branched-subunit amino acid transport protein